MTDELQYNFIKGIGWVATLPENCPQAETIIYGWRVQILMRPPLKGEFYGHKFSYESPIEICQIIKEQSSRLFLSNPPDLRRWETDSVGDRYFTVKCYPYGSEQG